MGIEVNKQLISRKGIQINKQFISFQQMILQPNFIVSFIWYLSFGSLSLIIYRDVILSLNNVFAVVLRSWQYNLSRSIFEAKMNHLLSKSLLIFMNSALVQ